MLDSDVTEALAEMTVDETSKQTVNVEQSTEQTVDKFFYKRTARHYMADEIRKDNKDAVLTAAAYHRNTKILITGIDILLNSLIKIKILFHNQNVFVSNSLFLKQTKEMLQLHCVKKTFAT